MTIEKFYEFRGYKKGTSITVGTAIKLTEEYLKSVLPDKMEEEFDPNHYVDGFNDCIDEIKNKTGI